MLSVTHNKTGEWLTMRRKITFETMDRNGNMKTVTVNSVADLLKSVADIKRLGGRVYRQSIKASDTIELAKDLYLIKEGKKK